MTSSMVYVVLTAVLVASLLLILCFLVLQILKQNRIHNKDYQNLLSNEQMRVQSLLNQVMAKDPMTLMNLNATTLTTSSGTSEGYVPTGTDEDEFKVQQQLIRQAGLGETLYDDDFADAGFVRAES